MLCLRGGLAHFGDFFGSPNPNSGPRALQRLNRAPTRLKPNMGVPLQHRLAHVTHDIKHHLFGDAGLSQLRAERVAQIVQPAVDPSRTAHGFPGPPQTSHRAARINRPAPVRCRKDVPVGLDRPEPARIPRCVKPQRQLPAVLGLNRYGLARRARRFADAPASDPEFVPPDARVPALACLGILVGRTEDARGLLLRFNTSPARQRGPVGEVGSLLRGQHGRALQAAAPPELDSGRIFRLPTTSTRFVCVVRVTRCFGR